MGNCQKNKIEFFIGDIYIDNINQHSFLKEGSENMMIKLFSLFKHEEKHLYCHNSEKDIDNYRTYEMVFLPKYCPEFLDSNLKKVFHNLPAIIKDPKTFLTDYQESFGNKTKINKRIYK